MRAILILLIHLLPAISHAAEIRQVQCRFLRFGADGAPLSAVTKSDTGAEVLCPLSSSELSERIACPAVDNQIVFLTKDDHKPMATVTIPAAIKTALLVFVENPNAGADASAWRVVVIEDSAKNFPDGGVFVANFYSGDIRFVIGEHKGMLKPAGVHGYAMPNQRDAFNMAPVVFQFEQAGKWRTASESGLRFLPGMRYMIFAYQDAATGRPRINTYQDFLSVSVPSAVRP